MQMGWCGILVEILDESAVSAVLPRLPWLETPPEMCCDVKTRALNTDPVWIVPYQVTVGPRTAKKEPKENKKAQNNCLQSSTHTDIVLCDPEGQISRNAEGLCFHSAPV